MLEITPDPPLNRSSSKLVTTREELIFLLMHAAELEHSLACACLFAAFSLKNDVSERGLTDIQAGMVRGWRRRLAAAAVDRMRNLAQISNLLTAIGELPIMARPALFRSTPSASSEKRLTLEPFSQQLLDRLVTYEHLNATIMIPIFAAHDSNEYQNSSIEFLTTSSLYDRIIAGFGSIPAEELFIGPKEAQANPHLLKLGDQLVTVVDLESAHVALATIIESGEGVSKGSAAGIFSTIHTEYISTLEDARKANQTFEPVRPVATNPVTRLHGEIASGTRIADQFTVAVADLFNGAYDTMLLLLRHFFTHTEETDTDLERLAWTSLQLMTAVIRPLSEALTQMPIDSASQPGRCAGPPFGDDGNTLNVVHHTAILALLDERLWQLAQAATKLHMTPGLPAEIREATAALQDLTCQFAPVDGPRGVAARIAELKQLQAGLGCTIQSELNGPYLATNVEALLNWLGEPLPTRPQMALCRCGESANKPFCDGFHARIDFTAQKDPKRVPDQRDTYIGTAITALNNRGICAHSGFCTDRLASAFHTRGRAFVTPNGARMDEIIRAVRSCPSGALSYALGSIEVRDGVDKEQNTNNQRAWYF